MSDFHHEKTTNDYSGGEEEKQIKIKHAECTRTVQDGKVKLSKKLEKTYKVIVTYVHLTDEEAKIKRAIIESIIKKNFKK